jgi:integrase
MSFLMCLRRMGRSEITPHGFRSSFRDWAEERNVYTHNAIEKCLAHRVKSKVEESYQRSDLLELRRPIMDAWATFATAKPSEKVVKIREA